MKERKKILQVTGSLKVGGMENVAMNIIRYIDRELYDVRFVVYGDTIGEYEEEVKALGGEVYHIPFPNEGLFKYCKALDTLIKETGPYTVVHSHNLFPSGMVMKVAKNNNIPIRIAHAHTNRKDTNISIFRRVYQNIMRMLMKSNATYYFACSNRAGEYLFGNSFAQHGYVMLNGVDIDKFYVSEEKKEVLRREFGITTQKVIGHTGRFIEVKNHDFLVDVFANALSKRDIKLLLIGDGPLKEKIEVKVKEMGIEEKVCFAGLRYDVPELLSIMDVYVLPYQYEGVSVSLMEAQAAGIPFVASQSAYSKESKVTDYGVSLSLEDSINVWTDAVIEQIYRGKLINSKEIIKEKGYDIESIVRYIQNNFY